MLIDVITQLSADSGLHLVQKRASLLQIANRAAKEMHHELECNKIYREVTLVVPINKVVSLPSFIGELRGTRMHTNELPFDVNSIGQPRYVSSTLSYKFKNWRDLGESPILYKPNIIGQLTVTTSGIETIPVVLKINGQTNLALSIEESLTIDITPKLTTNLFGPSFYSIACESKNRQFDISVKDAQGNLLATLYNNQPKTRYKIIDVSQVFWTIDTQNDESLIDVMYKLPAITLYNDTDSFYAGDDFDEAWYQMSMFFFLKTMQNRLDDAMASRASAMQFLQSAKESGDSGIVKKMQFGRNRFFGLFRKYRYYPGSITNVDNNVQSS